MGKKHKGYTPTPEHRAKILENLRKAWARSRAGLPRTPRQEAANRLNIQKAWAAMRERGWPHSQRQRAAARENIKKAQQFIREHGYPSTPRSRAASRANMAKANAARLAKGYAHSARQDAAASRNVRRAWLVSHDPANYARIHAVRLKNGLKVRELERTIEPLGENPAEYERLRAALERAFVPQDDLERKILRRLAETVWMHRRLYRAEARWEADEVERLLLGPPVPPEDVEALCECALNLVEAASVHDRFFQEDERITHHAVRLCHALVHHRSGGKMRFKLFRTRRSPEEMEWERESGETKPREAGANSADPVPRL